jgi:hypothetical protein
VIGANASQGYAEDTTYDVAVRFRNGETQVFQYRGYPPFRPGQSVNWTDRGLVPAGAFAVPPPNRETPESPYPESQPDAAESPVQPSAPQPGSLPPAPPAVAPAAPVSGPQVRQAELPSGQWVFTEQYGWVWMPYSPAYTFTPDYQRGDPYMFVYYPSAGWTWVYAPWLWGWGPMLFVGNSVGVRFEWYGHGWGRRWRGERPARYRGRMR